MSKGNKKTANSASEALEILWKEGFFKSWHYFRDISKELEYRGNNFTIPELGLALHRTNYLTRRGKARSYEYAQRIPPISKDVKKIETELFSDSLVKKLDKDFSEEISDLRWNFGKSGTCTAFLLRKILEKLIFKTFAKNGLDAKLIDKNGKFIGLEAMVNLASAEKIGGLPFLVSNTAKNVKGIKFLGDAAAHNPLTNIDMKTIIPQMPYIITAYEELSKKL